MKILEKIIGQPRVVTTLGKAIQTSRNSESDTQEMTHAWLFIGPPGSGKSTAMKAFATALICPRFGCTECIDCQSAMNDVHLDIENFMAEGLSIKVDEIRELVARSMFSPARGSRKIVIINNIEQLTEAASNVLLKVIEEPTPSTIWLLSSSNAVDVLPTLRSRCRQITFSVPNQQSIINLLKSKFGASQETSNKISRLAQGNISKAELLVNNPQSVLRRDEVIRLALSIEDIPSAFKAAEELIKIANEEIEELNYDKTEKNKLKRATIQTMENYLIDIASIFRDGLISNVGILHASINSEFANQISSYLSRFNILERFIILEKIEEARFRISNGYAPIITLEKLFSMMVSK